LSTGRILVHRQRLKQSGEDEADEHPEGQAEKFLGFPIPSLNHRDTLNRIDSVGKKGTAHRNLSQDEA
jgi:hypothetical protein